MGLENITQEILNKAKREAEDIRSEATAEAEKILQQAKEKAEEIKKEREKALEAEIERLRHQEASSASLEAKRQILNAKKELLDTVYKKAVEEISNLPPEKNAELLTTLLKKHASEGSKIYSNEKDRTLVVELSGLEYAGSIPCLGGFIIENEDGSLHLDYTYDTLLQDANERVIKQISEILFR